MVQKKLATRASKSSKGAASQATPLPPAADRGKKPMEEGSQGRKRLKGHKEDSLSPFRDREALKSFETIFSKCQFIVERNIDVKVLRTMEVHEQMRARGWLPFFDL